MLRNEVQNVKFGFENVVRFYFYGTKPTYVGTHDWATQVWLAVFSLPVAWTLMPLIIHGQGIINE